MRPWLRVCPRKRHTACGSLRIRRKAYAGELLSAVLRKRGCPGARELLPFAGAGAHVVGSSADGLQVSLVWQSAGLSSRPCHGLATRGVRADRVGVAPSAFQLSKGSFCEGSAGSASRRPLARETSAGRRLAFYQWRGASASRQRPKTGRCCPCSVQGLGWSAKLRRSRSTGTLGGKAAKGSRPFRHGADAGDRGERSAKAHVSFVLSHPRRGSGGPAVVLAGWVGCRSRRAASGPGSTDPGSSPLAFASSPRAGPSSAGERALEAGSRWRKPRAREQRHRWRAPRDPTRKARKRRACSGEGALVDGRRPGTVKPSSLTRWWAKPGLAARSERGSAAMPIRRGS
jgi:hypothetical protein